MSRIGKALGAIGLGASHGKEADGSTLPEFTVLDHEGQPRTRADLLGSPTVLWFYPAADTPG